MNDEDSFQTYRSAMATIIPRRQVSIGYIVRRNMLLSPLAQAYIAEIERFAVERKENLK